MTEEGFGERIRRRRTELNLRLRGTAKNAGISATFLSRIETGAEKAVPSEEVIRKLARILEDDFDALMLLAGRIPSEVEAYVKSDPRLPEFLRQARDQNIKGEKLLEMLEKQKKDG